MAAGRMRKFNPTLYANSPTINYLNPTSVIGQQIFHDPTVDNLFTAATMGLLRTPNHILPDQARRAAEVIARFQAYAGTHAPSPMLQQAGQSGRNLMLGATRVLSILRGRAITNR